MESILRHLDYGYPCWYRRDVVEILKGEYRLLDAWARPFYDSGRLPVDSSRLENVVSWDYCIHHNAGLVRDDTTGLEDLRRPSGWHLGQDDTGGPAWDHVRLCKYGSGLNCMMQEAFLEGFNPIILVGCDLGFKGRGPDGDHDHFDDRYNRRPIDPLRVALDEETHIDFHKMAKRWCDEHGVQILNATKGGALEVHPRVDYDQLFR